MANKILNGVKLNVTPAEIVTTPTQIGSDGDPSKSENISVTLAKIAGWYSKMTSVNGGNNVSFTGDSKSVNGINVTNIGTLTADSNKAATELTFVNITGGENTIKLKDTTYTASMGIKLDNGVFLHSNNVAEKPITAFVKVAYDAQGHVTDSTDVSATDIPDLPTSKITSGVFPDARIESADVWNAKQDALTFATNPSVTNKVATMADIANATYGLTGAMHFIGTKTEIPITGTFKDGDVICVGRKEYVYDSSKGTSITEHWILLGDESSYALNTVTIKGDNGLTGQGKLTSDVIISHEAKATGLTNLTADGRKYVTGLTFDEYGHVSDYTTGTETVIDTTYSIDGMITSDGWVTTLTGSDTVTSTSIVPLMGPASASEAGTAGLVPAPDADKQSAFLRGDGTWAVPNYTDTFVKQSSTDISNFRPILLGYNNSTDADSIDAEITNQAYFSKYIYVNPSTGSMYASGGVNASNGALRSTSNGVPDSIHDIPLIWHDNTNLWIGAEQTMAPHHIGSTYISSGYDSTSGKGNESIFVSVPNDDNTDAKNYAVLCENNYSTYVKKKRRIIAGHKGMYNTGDPSWFKIASCKFPAIPNIDTQLLFLVSKGSQSTGIGLLSILVRQNNVGTTNPFLRWVMDTGLNVNVSDFVITYSEGDTTGGTVEIWVHSETSYIMYHFDLIQELTRIDWEDSPTFQNNPWIFYDKPEAQSKYKADGYKSTASAISTSNIPNYNKKLATSLYNGVGNNSVTLTESSANYNAFAIKTNLGSFFKIGTGYSQHLYTTSPNASQDETKNTVSCGNIMIYITGTECSVTLSEYELGSTSSTVSAINTNITPSILGVYGLHL